MERLLIVGGHSGDEAVMAGAIAAKVTRTGGACHFVSLTNGDGGHPTLDRTTYARQKEEEAMRAAATLGATCDLWEVSSGALAFSPETAKRLATAIRRFRPDTVITHWANSIHRDHVAAHHITVAALGFAAQPTYGDGLDPFGGASLFFGDNWEDADGYRPSLYISHTEEDEERWLAACREFEFFREGFYSFDYTAYYTSLHRMRGALAARVGAKTPLASTLMPRPKSAYQIDII